MKKAWERPELIVLVRSQTQEAVLQSCKTTGVLGKPGFTNCFIPNNDYCDLNDPT